MKKCKACLATKDELDFPKDSTRPDGRHPYCLICKRKSNNASSANHRKRNRVRSTRWYNERKDHVKAYYQRPNIKAARKVYMAKWVADNPNWYKDYDQRNKAKIRTRKRASETAYYINNLNARIARALRTRLRSALKTNQKTGSAVKDLGCTVSELKLHLESKFQPGMSWDNWRSRGWHIDHIKPLISFDLTDLEQLKQAVHYTNLQPLWAKDNLVKGSRPVSMPQGIEEPCSLPSAPGTSP